MINKELNIANNEATRRDRFIRIVEKRVNRILDNLDSLGKCSNKSNYQYSDKDVKKIFGEIDKKIKEIKVLYQSSNGRKERFKLKDGWIVRFNNHSVKNP